jgi:hypothetical protein
MSNQPIADGVSALPMASRAQTKRRTRSMMIGIIVVRPFGGAAPRSAKGQAITLQTANPLHSDRAKC